MFATETPLLDAALASGNPLLATGNRGFSSHTSRPTMRQIASGMGRYGPGLGEGEPDSSRAERESATASAALWAKLLVATVVVTAGAVTGLLVAFGSGSRSIRG